MVLFACSVKELKGERERQALRSNGKHQTIPTAATTTNTTPSTTTSSDNEFEEDDYYLSNESDILDDEEFDADDDIFNVDFPHEQDALLNSSSYSLLQSSSSISQQKPYDDHHHHPWSTSSKTAATSSSSGGSCSSSSSPFDFAQMETILNLHRAQLRQVTECTKLETKLVGKMALELSSQEETTPESNMQFRSYLHELDEILEQKAGAVEALRDRINETVCQVPL